MGPRFNTTAVEESLLDKVKSSNIDNFIQRECDHVTGSGRTELKNRINKLQSVSKMVKQYQVGLINEIQLLDSCEGLGMDGFWIWRDTRNGNKPNVEITC